MDESFGRTKKKFESPKNGVHFIFIFFYLQKYFFFFQWIEIVHDETKLMNLI